MVSNKPLTLFQAPPMSGKFPMQILLFSTEAEFTMHLCSELTLYAISVPSLFTELARTSYHENLCFCCMTAKMEKQFIEQSESFYLKEC